MVVGLGRSTAKPKHTPHTKKTQTNPEKTKIFWLYLAIKARCLVG